MIVLVEKALDFVAKNKKQVLVGFAGVAILTVVAVGFSFYRTHVNEQAHKALLQALSYYDGSVRFSSEAEKWQKTEQVFKDGAQSYRGTHLGPVFLAYQSEALLNLGKHDEAIAILTRAVGMMKNAAAKDFYRVKLALMMLDSSKEENKQQGLVALKEIANNTQSAAHEVALYQLGAYNWDRKNFAEAKSYWQMLLVKYGTDGSRQPSPYVELVKEKMALLSIEIL